MMKHLSKNHSLAKFSSCRNIKRNKKNEAEGGERELGERGESSNLSSSFSINFNNLATAAAVYIKKWAIRWDEWDDIMGKNWKEREGWKVF